MQALRMGVAGVGHFGRFHALKLAKFGLLAGVFDASAERAAVVAGECESQPLSLDALIETCDAVVVAAPTAHHFALAEQVLRAGRHAFIEKPIAATLEQADILIALAEAQGLVLQVGHIERYSAAIQTLRREMGSFAPRALEATRVAPFRPRSLDISVVLDLMIHDIDLVLSLVDAPLVDVRAVGAPVASGLPDYVVAQLRFQNGAQAQITASRVAVAMERKLRLLGDGGEIRVDFLARELRAFRPGGAAPDENMPGWGRDEATWTEHDSLEAEQRAFIASIQHAAPVEANAAVARAALATALRIEAALG
jgi:predicted dehydrogenase